MLKYLPWRFRRYFLPCVFLVTRKPSGAILSAGNTRFAKKPQWVIKEIIRLKAHMPTASGYVIAATFNQLHDKKYGMTIGKTFAYKVFKQQQYAIYLKRKTIKTKPPVYYAKNQLWQMDITHVQDNNKQVRMILGMVDCGTRANVCLQTMANKTSTSI
ncbi:MAG: putative transposase, partial [Candidatus Paceibacteria bacterium]